MSKDHLYGKEGFQMSAGHPYREKSFQLVQEPKPVSLQEACREAVLFSKAEEGRLAVRTEQDLHEEVRLANEKAAHRKLGSAIPRLEKMLKKRIGEIRDGTAKSDMLDMGQVRLKKYALRHDSEGKRKVRKATPYDLFSAPTVERFISACRQLDVKVNVNVNFTQDDVNNGHNTASFTIHASEKFNPDAVYSYSHDEYSRGYGCPIQQSGKTYLSVETARQQAVNEAASIDGYFLARVKEWETFRRIDRGNFIKGCLTMGFAAALMGTCAWVCDLDRQDRDGPQTPAKTTAPAAPHAK